MQSIGCFANAFALKAFNGIKLCGYLLWSEASMLHKDIYICDMENCNILYVAVILCARMWIEISVSVISSALFDVILYARVWIEIFRGGLTKTLATRHLPCEGEGALLIIFASKAYEKTSV